MEIFKWLEDTSLIDSYLINDFRKSDTSFYLNLKIVFKDQSELHIREYVDEHHRKYSFHWQDSLGELLCRWDNAPHFRQLSTYPDHKHLASGEVVESFHISFDEILISIKHQMAIN